MSSKELLVVLRLLAQLSHEEKMMLLNYLSGQEDNEGSLSPSVFSPDATEE